MQITEKEAIKILESGLEFEYRIPLLAPAYKTAIAALEEIQQYRATGMTAEQIKEMQMDYCAKGAVLEEYKEIGTVEELQKAVKEEDVLKFYYIESEDKYVVGQRVDNFYYAEIGKTGISYRMSRCLPWGKHVVAPETAWKEHTYPSEPKEIPFFEWLQGFIKKECGGTLDQCREAVERMKREKQGMSLRLQFRVDDYVWDDEFKSSYRITGYSFGEAEDYIHDPVSKTEVVYYYTNYCGSIIGSFSESEIGKTMFHSEEEAEAALEKMKGEEHEY